jgi:hypothetical protein
MQQCNNATMLSPFTADMLVHFQQQEKYRVLYNNGFMANLFLAGNNERIREQTDTVIRF